MFPSFTGIPPPKQISALLAELAAKRTPSCILSQRLL